MTHAAISVLVVEDDPLVAQAHGAYVERVDGFVLSGTAHNAQDALRLLKSTPIDVVLLDFNLPDAHGLEVCRALRMARTDVDVIAVTANRDLASVRAAVSLGVVYYLLKPFTFRALQDKLQRYQDFRQQLRSEDPLAGQGEIDRAFASLRAASDAALPHGLSAETLEAISRAMQRGEALSSTEVAARCSVSRVTARRYLEHLTDAGVTRRRQRHHGSGRPEFEYLWGAVPKIHPTDR